MTVARDLLRELAPDVGENPLGMLGLSRQILSLGLSESELYSVCQRMARVLLAAVHSDRVAVTSRTEYLARRFSDAMQTLKSEEAFHDALAELRREQGFESDGVERARRATDEWRKRAEAFERERDDERARVSELRRAIGRERQVGLDAVARARDEVHSSKVSVAQARAFERHALRKRIEIVRRRHNAALKRERATLRVWRHVEKWRAMLALLCAYRMKGEQA